jgi:hypothetical protein
MVDVHPAVEEIKPYVSVGPTPNLSITVHKDTFDKGFLIVSFILVIGISIIVAVMIIFSYNTSQLPPPPPPLNSSQEVTLDTNLGAATTARNFVYSKNNIPEDGSKLTTKYLCEDTENTSWDGYKCICEPPFFGPYCSRERHDNKYFAVGVPNETTIDISVIDDIMTDGKSFNSNGTINSCSSYCNNTKECVGFLYQYPGNCTLLSDNVIIPEGEGISYSHDVEPTLYLKDSENLQFEGRIFLGVISNSFPSRYWLVDETPYYSHLVRNNVKKILFAPGYTLMYGSYTGIYCRFPFTIGQVPDILKRNPDGLCYIHEAGTTINLPPDWKYKTPLYVVYV